MTRVYVIAGVLMLALESAMSASAATPGHCSSQKVHGITYYNETWENVHHLAGGECQFEHATLASGKLNTRTGAFTLPRTDPPWRCTHHRRAVKCVVTGGPTLQFTWKRG